MTPPFDLLADEFRYGTGEWHFSQFEELGAEHPLIKSGILAACRQSAYYNCPRTCCDDPQREVIEEDGSFLAMCPYSGAPKRLTREELTVWEYDPERMCRLLQKALACAALRPFDENTWCLGQSALPALAGRLVFVQTKADEASLCRALASTPNAPYILLTGRADTLSSASPIRPQTFTFASTLTLDARGTLTLNPLAFASLPPLQAQSTPMQSVLVAGFTPEGSKQMAQLSQRKPAEKGYFTDRNLCVLFGVSENTPYNWRKGKSLAPEGFHRALKTQDYNAMQMCAEKYRANRQKCDVMNTKHIIHNLSDKTLSKRDRAY